MNTLPLAACVALAAAAPALADGTIAAQMPDAVRAQASPGVTASLDVRAAHVHRHEGLHTFSMTMNAAAGSARPDPVGALAGAPVTAYVWPTSLDPSAVGFEAGTGILALTVTSHPDFDDTPLFDEDGDGDRGNDGIGWHSHWVVLAPDEACGPGALGVRDIPDGETPDLPLTWPGLPILIDSPGYTPLLEGAEVSVTVPLADPAPAGGLAYDGLTAAIRVNADLSAPLLCVTDVFDIASGDLSLPGRVE